MRHFRRQVILTFLAVAFMSYISAYFVLTRSAMARSNDYGLIGYFFVFPPEDSARWRDSERPYRMLFLPLILIEMSLGSETVPGSPPCFTFE